MQLQFTFLRTGLFFFKYLEKSAQVQKFSHATGIAIIVARRAQVFEAIFPSVCPAFVFKVHHYSNIWEHSASKLVDFAMNKIVGFQNNKTTIHVVEIRKEFKNAFKFKRAIVCATGTVQ